MIADPETPFPLIRIEGDPFPRGVAYGRAARGRIRRSIAFYERAIERTGGLSFGEACDIAVANEPRWRAEAPEIFDEIEGIAHGSGVPGAAVLVLNARDTFMHRRRSWTGSGPHDFDDGCTSFAVLSEASDDGHVRSGQNWDYHPDIRDTVVLLHVRPADGPTQLMIVEAGQVGRQGANDRGVSLQANGLPSERRDETALPGPIVRRMILGEATFDASLVRALGTPRAGRTNLMLTSREDRVVDIEASHTTSRVVEALRDAAVSHANHFELGAPADLAGTMPPASPDSVCRSASAIRWLTAARQRGGIGAADLMSLARSHDDRGGQICDHGVIDRAWATVACTITDLTDGVLHVAAGPPCEHPFVAIDIASGRVARPAGVAAPAGSPYPSGP